MFKKDRIKDAYPPLPRGNPELGADTYSAAHLYEFADATFGLRLRLMQEAQPETDRVPSGSTPAV